MSSPSPDAATTASPASGRCLCGDVGYRARIPPKWVAHCHCTLCRRSSGAAFVTWVGWELTGVEIRDPDRNVAWYRSSEFGERGFCGRCGSTLFFRSPRWPGELHVTRASIDGELDRQPQAHVYWDSHVDWVRLADALPRKTAAQMG